MDDSELFHQGQEIDRFGVIWITKRRLLRNVCKKTGAFQSWSIEEKSEIDPATPEECLALRNQCVTGVAESGLYDITPDGSFFGLSDDQKSRALEKRIRVAA